MRNGIDYSAFTDAIRESISAEQLGHDYGLDPGRDGRCRCIFCKGDRKDTLKLYGGNRGFYCYRCHKAGDVIALYMQIVGVTFPQAVKNLNEQYGLNLPLTGADPEAAEKARRKAEQRKRERAKKAEHYKRLLTALWDASDAAWFCDKTIAELAPKDPSEPWRQRFIIALKYRDEIAEYRDSLQDEMYFFSLK